VLADPFCIKNSPSGLLLDEKVAGNRIIGKLVEKFASFPIMGGGRYPGRHTQSRALPSALRGGGFTMEGLAVVAGLGVL